MLRASIFQLKMWSQFFAGADFMIPLPRDEIIIPAWRNNFHPW